MTSHLLHLSIGPVQGFIGEARRTRDLWAGSFLLSWLSARAMLAVETAVAEAGGDPLRAVVFPEVAEDDLMEAVRRRAQCAWSGKGRASAVAPHIGSVPNRFKAEVASPEVAKAAARAASEVVQKQWRALADEVWKAFVGPAATAGNGDRVRDIWDRQIGNFWDLTWVAGERQTDKNGRPTDGAWLDQRKNWRTHYPAIEEGGDHCQLMGFYQELSGFVRARGEGPAQDAFWSSVRRRVGPYNLRLRERLCAVALVKRLFPALPKGTLERVIGWVPAEDSFKIRHWPSVAYVAAYPWMLEAWRLAPEACGEYQRKVHDLTGGWRPVEDMQDRIYGETQPTSLTGEGSPESSPATEEDEGEQSDPGVLGERHAARPPFFKLDGGFFHADAIRSMDIETFHTPAVARSLPAGTNEERTKLAQLLKERREEAARELEALHKAMDNKRRAGRRAVETSPDSKPKPDRRPAPRASEFYAVLLADGDHIGKNLRTPGGEDAAKQGLAKFTAEVSGIVSARRGATIYAGGDDVLALLPVDDAIPAALALRQAYGSAFSSKSGAGEEAGWTLSVAIVLAQYHIPLRAVMAEAHRQMDDIAKDRNGRDSLALAVLKPGGLTFDWVSAWEGLVDGAGRAPPEIMQRLAKELQMKRELTTGFLYNVRDRYQALFDGDAQVNVTREQMQRFLLAEHMRAGGTDKRQASDKAQAERRVADLMRIGFPLERKTSGAPQPAGRFNFDAGPLMRFLAEEGRWFMADDRPDATGEKP